MIDLLFDQMLSAIIAAHDDDQHPLHWEINYAAELELLMDQRVHSQFRLTSRITDYPLFNIPVRWAEDRFGDQPAFELVMRKGMSLGEAMKADRAQTYENSERRR